MKKYKLTLCGFCRKPIHVLDFGGVQKDIGFFHGACLIKSEAEKQIKKHIKPIKRMKKTLLLIAGAILSLASYAQCPAGGDNAHPRMQHQDSLKNRTIVPPYTATVLSIDSLLKPGPDATRFCDSAYVRITVYLFDAKVTGPESCNCHSKNKEDYDYHLTVTKDSSHTARNERIICEVTPHIRPANMQYSEVKKMIGHMVTITGWLFFDEEHHQNAFNSNPTGTNVWRDSCWEVHPITNIALK